MNKTILLVLIFGFAMLVTPSATAQLTCSPAPCVTANIEVANGGVASTIATYALAADPTSPSNLAVAANDLVNMSSCFGAGSHASWTGLFLSNTQAGSWSGGCQPPSGGDNSPNFGPIAVYDSHGNLFSGQLGTFGVWLQENGGTFFPTFGFTDAGTVDFYNYDFPGIAIDNKDCLWITAWEFGSRVSNHKPVSAIAVGHACAPYTSWKAVRVSGLIAAPKAAYYPRVSVGGDGTILVTWAQNNGGNSQNIFAATSSDGGATWTPPTQVFTIPETSPATCSNNPQPDRALPHTCVRMFYYPVLASTYSAGTAQVYHAVYPNHGANGKITIDYVLSVTDGATFTPPEILSKVAGDTTATGDQFQPCIATSGQKIGFAWLDTRNSPAGSPDSLYDAYAMTATVSPGAGGPQIAFSPVHRLSTQSSSTTVETQPNSEYLGDWTGCAWQNGIFYYAFPSTANGTHQVAMIAGLNP